jgi:hypothetical protein
MREGFGGSGGYIEARPFHRATLSRSLVQPLDLDSANGAPCNGKGPCLFRRYFRRFESFLETWLCKVTGIRYRPT